MTQFTLFDVGANYGVDSLPRTASDGNVRTFAFEPTPELIQHLTAHSQGFADRYTIIPCAVSDFDGTATFNVAAHADWGCSSLLTFSEGLDKTWKNRTDLHSERQIEVNVIRLDNWLKQHPEITSIDFFHCDTQGTDLAVLRGMADYFSMIKEGVIEVPQSEEVKLYKGQHTKEEALDFLSDKGYEVFKTHSQQNEDNLFFRPIQR